MKEFTVSWFRGGYEGFRAFGSLQAAWDFIADERLGARHSLVLAQRWYGTPIRILRA